MRVRRRKLAYRGAVHSQKPKRTGINTRLVGDDILAKSRVLYPARIVIKIGKRERTTWNDSRFLPPFYKLVRVVFEADPGFDWAAEVTRKQRALSFAMSCAALYSSSDHVIPHPTEYACKVIHRRQKPADVLPRGFNLVGVERLQGYRMAIGKRKR